MIKCSHKWHVFPILFFFMSCPELPMGISGVGLSPVQSGGPLIIFQLLRCGNLVLNRFYPTFLSGRHVFKLGSIWTPPTFVHMPLGVQMPPHMSPILLCESVYSQRLLHVVAPPPV